VAAASGDDCGVRQMLRVLRVVFFKEAYNLLRDRRALFWLFATPLLMPCLSVVGGSFLMWQIARQTRGGLPVAVVNGEQISELILELEADPVLRLVDAPFDVEGALQSGELMAVLEVPPDADERLRAEEPLTLTLTSGRSGWLPDLAAISIARALQGYESDVLEERLAQRELSRAWMDPIRLERDTAATTGIAATPPVGEQAPSMLGSLFLFMVVVSWVFSSSLPLMADMTVGEKEHHTMEPLLVTPASRVGIVMGKIALSIIVSVVTIGMWSLNSLAYVLFLAFMPSDLGSLAPPASFRVGGLGLVLVWLLLLMLPLMVMVNGLVAAVGTFAKNQREANLFAGVLQLLLLPGTALLTIFGIGATPPPGVYALPMVGVLVAMRDLFGSGIAPQTLALTWGAATAYAVGSVLLAAYVFSREWALMRGV